MVFSVQLTAVMPGKYLFLLMVIGFPFGSLMAQQTTAINQVVGSSGVGLKDKIIKDSAGTVLPYDVWHKMVVSGSYMLRSSAPNADTMMLVKMDSVALATRSRVLANLPPPPSSPAFPVGVKKELYSRKDIEGKKVDFTALEGKVIVLNFWFTDCMPCRQEIPELNKLVADNPDVEFIAIGLDLKYEIKDFIKNTPFNYRQIYDARDDADKYGVKTYPTNVVIDKKGVTRFSSSGFGAGSLNYLKKTIAQVKTEN